jgi:hypothetical protein
MWTDTRIMTNALSACTSTIGMIFCKPLSHANVLSVPPPRLPRGIAHNSNPLSNAETGITARLAVIRNLEQNNCSFFRAKYTGHLNCDERYSELSAIRSCTYRTSWDSLMWFVRATTWCRRVNFQHESHPTPLSQVRKYEKSEQSQKRRPVRKEEQMEWEGRSCH